MKLRNWRIWNTEDLYRYSGRFDGKDRQLQNKGATAYLDPRGRLTMRVTDIDEERTDILFILQANCNVHRAP